jgi:hypothetical protein
LYPNNSERDEELPHPFWTKPIPVSFYFSIFIINKDTKRMLSPILNSFIRFFTANRRKKIERAYFNTPVETQQAELSALLDFAKDTEIGKKYRFDEIKNTRQFGERVPLHDYASLQNAVERMMRGEKDVLWPGKIRWFAQSSGTTSSRSKYIPVSDEILEKNHFQGGKDLIMFYLENVPGAKFLRGKTLKLGGTVKKDKKRNIFIGDLSGIMIDRLPFWAEYQSVPEEEIALIPDWQEKINRIIEVAAQQDIRSLVGIPSWFQTLLTGLLERYNKKHIREIWPGLEVFFHGGIHFEPYREGFRKMIGHPDIRYMEVYNASEGFFGLQNDLKQNDFLLMLDYFNYFEFIPMDVFDGTNSAKVVSLDEVRPGVNYALVISNASGLWRYIIGDTIKFTSVYPFRFVITGRTKHFINIVGEEVIVDNTEKAIRLAAEKHGVLIRNYTVAPVYMEGNRKGAHEWMIEFEPPPMDLEGFTRDLDAALQQVNSDYEIKRTKDISLRMPTVHVARSGLFEDWLGKHDKLGGQHKVPRLSPSRDLMEELLEMNYK